MAVDYVIWPRLCCKQRFRPACASVQSDQHLCYSLSAKYTSPTSSMQNYNISLLLTRLVWALLGQKPEDRFSCLAVYMNFWFLVNLMLQIGWVFWVFWVFFLFFTSQSTIFQSLLFRSFFFYDRVSCLAAYMNFWFLVNLMLQIRFFFVFFFLFFMSQSTIFQSLLFRSFFLLR